MRLRASAILFACVLWACGSNGSAPAQPDGGSGGSGSGGGTGDGGTDGGATLPKGGGDWLQYRHDARGASENPAEFTTAAAATLTERWQTELGYDANGNQARYVYTQAVIADDLTIFTTAFRGRVVAFDTSSTGKNPSPRWSRDLDATVSTACGGAKQEGFWGSVAIVGDAVYAASPDGNLYALARSSGDTLAGWPVKIADGSAAAHGEFVQSSPAVSLAFNKIYLGVASSEHCDLIAGRVIAVDLTTHAVTRKELLAPGQRGAGVWTSVTVAEDEGRIYVASGNQVGGASGEPLAQAIIAMDARTLDVLDHWQNPTPLENADFGGSPVIFDAGGMKLIAATSKDGYVYVLRRDALSAGPVWTKQIAVLDPADPGMGGNATAGWGTLSTPAYAHGKLYVAGGRTPQGEPGSVLALDPATGAQIWKHATPGYVIAPPAAAGDILAVESGSVDYKNGWLEILDQATGSVVYKPDPLRAVFGAPSIGHGLVVWTDNVGHVQVLGVPAYR